MSVFATKTVHGLHCVNRLDTLYLVSNCELTQWKKTGVFLYKTNAIQSHFVKGKLHCWNAGNCIAGTRENEETEGTK